MRDRTLRDRMESHGVFSRSHFLSKFLGELFLFCRCLLGHYGTDIRASRDVCLDLGYRFGGATRHRVVIPVVMPETVRGIVETRGYAL